MSGCERNPSEALKYPQVTDAGAFPLFESVGANGTIQQLGPAKVFTDKWVAKNWRVRTNDTITYKLELRNGGVGCSCKGTAYFRNLKWDKIIYSENPVQKNDDRDAEVKKLIASGKEHKREAMEILQKAVSPQDYINAVKERDLAIADYEKALSLGTMDGNSISAGNVYYDMGECYKWIPYAPDKVDGNKLSMSFEKYSRNLENGLKYLLMAAKICEEKVDIKKHNIYLSGLYIDIGGLCYMKENMLQDLGQKEGDFKEALSWRIKAYKALTIGDCTTEDLGKAEMGIRGVYKEIKASVPVEKYMVDNGIEPIIESVKTQESNARLREYIVKLKDIETPFVWVMG